MDEILYVRWHDIDDKTPENEQVVLTWDGEQIQLMTFFDCVEEGEVYYGYWFVDFDDNEIDNITHWMELPPAPRKEGEEQ